MTRIRADQRLVELGLCESRTRAQARIMAGHVYLDTERIEKPGQLVARDAKLSLAERERYVSRGGIKLERALARLGFSVRGYVAADLGASTGGFSDCLLQHGARRVYAVDVGERQLAEKLRTDARVIVMDRTNARHLTVHSFPEPIELSVVDASFISLDKLLPAIFGFLPAGGHLLALIKPQFEAGREEVARLRGVISDPVVRTRAVEKALADVAAAGFEVLADCESELPGPKGNVEHFVLARRRVPSPAGKDSRLAPKTH